MGTTGQDLELVGKAKAGNREAFKALVEKYQERVFGLAYEVVGNREDAEDIAQEAFVKAYLSLGEFRADSSFFTWLYRIVYNMSIDYRRKVMRRGGEALELDENTAAESSQLTSKVGTPQDEFLRKEQRNHIQKALATISDEHRAVITLREIDGLSYDEIARVTGISLGTVMSRLHYARKRLQQALGHLTSNGDEGPDHERKMAVGEEEDHAGLKFFCRATS